MRIFVPLLLLLLSPSWSLAGGGKKKGKGHGDKHSSRLTDEAIPLDPEAVPKRPKPILELGEPFLGTGTLAPGFRLPTGAVWQPSLLVFGTLRTALQSNGYNPSVGDARTTELAARLDLFANLSLSGTERLVLGFRNLDEDGRFTGHVFNSDLPGVEEGGRDELNGEIGSLFFEGDIGEIFPNLSPRDFRPTDIGFSIGRQPLFFQEGLLINDSIDGVGFTWNSLQPRNSSNFRTTFFFGWNGVDRGNVSRDSGRLLGLFTSFDMRSATMDIDIAHSEGDGIYDPLTAMGISAVRRIGLVNSSLRFLGSYVDDGQSDSNGMIAFSELSITPHRTHDLAYFNAFWVLDRYTPVAQGPANGGALARAGISFAGVGLGNYGAPLDASTRDVAGSVLGYQKFFDHNRKQIIFELAGRVGTEADVPDQYGFAVRYQMAMARRFALVVDGFVNHISNFDDDQFFGGRCEFQVRL